MPKYTVSLGCIVNEFSLKTVYSPKPTDELFIQSADVNRSGLHLTGFYTYFENDRIEIFGNSEHALLESFTEEERLKALDMFFSQKPPAVVFTRNLEIPDDIISVAMKYQVPILSCDDSTSGFMSSLISFLHIQLAPRITRHGVLVEVYGEGILIVGESGVGKSETAIELIKRGHRLIADDAVEIKRTSRTTLVGSSPDNIRHFIELRGIGIINARRIFGMGSVKISEKIDLVVNLEPWDNKRVYDRMGLDSEHVKILGLEVPSVTVPVKPGRNVAVIIEVAAMNNRQKKMGYNAAEELLRQLGMEGDIESTSSTKSDWD